MHLPNLNDNDLFKNELKYFTRYKQVIGVDEAGRGPIAGPLVVAGCCLGKNNQIKHLNDSKKLTLPKREKIYEEIIDKAVKYTIHILDIEIIDQINILQATLSGMARVASELSEPGCIVLFDGNHIPPDQTYQCLPIVKGDSLIASIAAASIIAKVTRDKIMHELDRDYPEYNLKKNKGYLTREHLEALKKYGYSKIHRKSFKPKALNPEYQLSFKL